MKAAISTAGRSALASAQVMFGLATIAPSTGSSAASARYQSFGSKAVKAGPSIWLANTMPS